MELENSRSHQVSQSFSWKRKKNKNIHQGLHEFCKTRGKLMQFTSRNIKKGCYIVGLTHAQYQKI